MVLGGVMVNHDSSRQLSEEIRQISGNKVKQFRWTDTKRLQLPTYKELVDWFFYNLNENHIHFNSLIIDCHQLDHHRYNQGDKEIGSGLALFLVASA
jgi:hypothetical protein